MNVGDGLSKPPSTGSPAHFDERKFREVLGCFATGITVVSAIEDAQPVGFTCQAFTSLSLDPPMVALAPSKTSTSWPRIAEAGWFCVNILAESQEELCRAFAVSGSDKFVGVEWSPGTNGVPRLDGALAHIDCELVAIHDAGDHELVTGRVADLAMGSGKPLVFYRGSFSTVSI